MTSRVYASFDVLHFFFLVFGFHKLKGVGLHKPHMPQVCSSKYYGLYPLNDTFPPLAPNRYAPQGAPQVAVQTSAQLRTWINSTASQEECTFNFDIWNSSKCTLPDAEARALKRGYWACISQTDVRFFWRTCLFSAQDVECRLLRANLFP